MCYSQFFLTKLLALRFLFSTAVRELEVAKLLILGISSLTSFILALRLVLVAKLVISGILSSMFYILAYLSTFFSLSISNLSTLDIKLAKSTFLAKDDVSIPLAFFKSVFVAQLDKFVQLSLFLLKILVLENIHSFILCLFYQSNC